MCARVQDTEGAPFSVITTVPGSTRQMPAAAPARPVGGPEAPVLTPVAGGGGMSPATRAAALGAGGAALGGAGVAAAGRGGGSGSSQYLSPRETQSRSGAGTSQAHSEFSDYLAPAPFDGGESGP